MTVKELIEKLKTAPQDAVVTAWDGDFQEPMPIIAVHVESDEEVWFETGNDNQSISQHGRYKDDM